MPQPNMKELLVSGPLANVSIAYKNKSYVSDQLFHIIDDVDPKAQIAKYAKGAWFRDEAQQRGPGAEAQRGGYPTGWVSFLTKEYAFAKEVTDEDRKFALSRMAPPLKPDQDALEFVADKLDLSRERRVAAAIKAASWIDGNGAGGEDAEGGWAVKTAGNNTFLEDINKGRKVIHASTGIKPNCLLIDFGTYNLMKEAADILDKIKYTQRGVLTKDILASLADLDEIIIGEAIVNTAKETKAGTDWTASYVWEVNAAKGMGFLFYKPPAPGLKVPAPGYIPRISQGNGMARRTTTWREAAKHQDVYEVAEELDIVICGLDLGYMFKDTAAT